MFSTTNPTTDDTQPPVSDDMINHLGNLKKFSVAVINVETTPVKPPRLSTNASSNELTDEVSTQVKKTIKTPRETYHDAVIEIKPDVDDDEETSGKHQSNNHILSQSQRQAMINRKLSAEIECDLNLGGIGYDTYNENNNKNTAISILPETNYPRKQSTTISHHKDSFDKIEAKCRDSANTLSPEDCHSITSSERHERDGRRASFVKRASISIDFMRRKSIERVKHTFSSYKGIIMAMSSSVFFTLTAVIVKYLKDIHPGEMACFRFLGILLFTIPMIITAEVNPLGPRDKRHFLLLRGM